MDTLDPNHPKQCLLFFVAQDFDESMRVQLEEFVSRLASARSWLSGPPQFVNTREELQEDDTSGDFPIETLGGYLEVYSPIGLPREVDLQLLDEVTFLVGVIS